MAIARMTEEERIKIGTEIQKRVKALAILDLNLTIGNTINHKVKSVKVIFFMKSKSRSSWNWSDTSGTSNLTTDEHVYPKTHPHQRLIVRRTREQFPKCQYIPDHYFEFTATTATDKEVNWANSVLEEMGITEETGDYYVTVETMTTISRLVIIKSAYNAGHAQMMALNEVSKSPVFNWCPKDIDVSSVNVKEVKKH